MSADWTSPRNLRSLLIELKARRYRDPIQRLAYLKKAANQPAPVRRTRLRVSLYSILMLLLFIFIGLRIQTVTDVKAGNPLEKGAPGSAVLEVRAESVPLEAAWQVEAGADFELYSNGLRIENRYSRPGRQRSYVTFQNGKPGLRRSNPAGILFHTSESLLAPFEADQNSRLTRFGRDLLEYVSREQCYHFLIDRFGRVFRIVPETDVANHAGYSVWADKDGMYLNLNHSFLGISFEAQTQDIHKGAYLGRSQIQSAHQLVEMLVSKYKIPLYNCVTHAQVSVDPETMTIGHHTDGAGDFPFQELGIPDNYLLPIPSLFLCGFDYDPEFLMKAGTRMWKGVIQADERLRRGAELQHVPVDRHKQVLREQYQASIETMKNLGIIKEN